MGSDLSDHGVQSEKIDRLDHDGYDIKWRHGVLYKVKARMS